MKAEPAPSGPLPLPLEVRDLNVAYQSKVVVWDADFDAPAGKLVAIVGPNGAGKSTLLKAALGLVPMASGSVKFFGRPYAEVRHRVAYVPQRESVDWDFPVSAVEVVAMGLYRQLGWCRPVRRRQRDQARAALVQVGLGDYADRQISQLSGGQQQRVFLARALVQEADLYLMDEPFASVDAATERTIVQVLRDLRTRGRTVVCVHHDLPTVPEYFDHVALLNMRVVAQGPVVDIFTAENLGKTYGARLTLLEEAAQAVQRARVTAQHREAR
jgi:manganese/zinc/iron transport system ATP- binding protein